MNFRVFEKSCFELSLTKTVELFVYVNFWRDVGWKSQKQKTFEGGGVAATKTKPKYYTSFYQTMRIKKQNKFLFKNYYP